MTVYEVIDVDGYLHLDTNYGLLRVNHAQQAGQSLRPNPEETPQDPPTVARIHLQPREGLNPTTKDWYNLAHHYYGYPYARIYRAGSSVIIYGSHAPNTDTPRLPRGATYARS